MTKDRKGLKISDQPPLHASVRVLIAPDKFKGTLTSEAAAKAIERGLRRAWPKVKTTCFTLTDGGEGFLELMVHQASGQLRTARTVDAALRPCRAKWGILRDGHTAVIGLTSASGIAQLPKHLRNPEKTTNLGTGELLNLAVQEGCHEIHVGLGGSATTEGGISLAAAIGYKFIDKDDKEIPLNGEGLARLAKIAPPPKLPKAHFIVATDVDNPLFGPRGAAYQFAPQKGADLAMVKRLDANLRHLALIAKRDLGKDFARELGAGAAGGCGYGLMTFFNAKRENGFQLVRVLTGLDASIRQHDLVITGEGCFDRTSLLGKAPSQLAELAHQMKKPVWALCGRVDLTPKQRACSPFDQIAALSTKENPGPHPDTLTSRQHAKRLEQLAYEVASALPLQGK